MTRTRAERRHHHNRMKNRVKSFYTTKSIKEHWGEDFAEIHICKRAENRQPCSCFMCGNPRKYFKQKTLQEKRQEQHERYGKDEC